MTVLADVTDLGALLERLRASDRNYRVFGSDNHNYRVGPVLSRAELSAFEAAHALVLPEDYRCFLMTVGNGGAGPFYGLFPMDDSDSDLSAPFPFTPDIEIPREELVRLSELDVYPGVLMLCDQGCGTYSYLVVNGPTYGTIWDGCVDVVPTGLSFGAWYRSWLEQALRTLENEKLVSRLRVGMSKADVLTEVAGDWRERPAPRPSISYFEASEIPAQLELDERGRVVAVKPWPFIVARPSR